MAKKINVLTELINPLTKLPMNDGEGAITLRRIVYATLNIPANQLAAVGVPAGGDPQIKAALRAGIIEKVLDDEEVEFLPEQEQEILTCISAVQSSTIYNAVKKIFNGVPQIEPETKKLGANAK